MLLSFVVLLAACAREPAFRMSRPASFDSDGKAIAIIGDLQQTSAIARFVRRRENNASAQQQLIADLKDRIANLGALIIVGDLVFSGRSARHWAHFDSLAAPFAAQMPVLPAIGNHDYPCFFVELCRTSVISRGMLERFPWFEPGSPYAVESGDLLLLFLDSETGLESQRQWLREQLGGAAGRYAAALVFYHHPAWSNSIDRGAVGDPDVQAYFIPAIRSAELPVIAFSGHIHGFEYIVRDGVHYVTTAGGGGPRGPLADERPFDRYRGPDCLRDKDGARLRPFNYVLLTRTREGIDLEVRGFCGDENEEVRVLDSIEIGL